MEVGWLNSDAPGEIVVEEFDILGVGASWPEPRNLTRAAFRKIRRGGKQTSGSPATGLTLGLSGRMAVLVHLGRKGTSSPKNPRLSGRAAEFGDGLAGGSMTCGGRQS